MGHIPFQFPIFASKETMQIILSPAKSLQTPATIALKPTQPRLKKDTAILVQELAQKSLSDLKKLMHLSEKLASLNYERYQNFEVKYTQKNAEPAGLAFNGAVYQGLELDTFAKADLQYAHEHLRILSGLYGVMRPLDLMQPYRLEMGTKLPINGHKNLYDFWGDKITDLLNKDLKTTKSKTVINLASKEYFKSINLQKLNGRLLTIDFREERNGVYKFITFNAKKARGQMARYILLNRIENTEHIKGFLEDGYTFNDALSAPDKWVFTR